MYYLHASNRTENLLQHLAAVIRADEQRSLFTKELFLIQSQGMERMVCQTMADEFGCFCNFQFLFPLRFLGLVAEKIGLSVSSDGYEREVLTWRLESLLRDLSSETLAELRQYLSGDNVALKRFQLARKLAHIFDQYQMMRLEMLSSWAKGETTSSHPAEKWERELWLSLTSDSSKGDHRGLLFKRVIDTLGSGRKLSQNLPERIFVLGLHIMPPIFLEFLSKLSSHCDVHLFILSPCKHYWGDVENKRAQLKRALDTGGDGQSSGLESEEKHPLLMGLGQQGREFQKMMLENVDFEVEFESFEDPAKKSPLPTLLQIVQSDLLHGEVSTRANGGLPKGDNSIQITSCHSKFREIAILKDHILRFLHDDSSLKLRDIIVMAPDIQEYAALIPSVFSDLQHSIADRSLQSRNGYIAAFLSFIDLFKGRFGWNEVLELLRIPKIFSHLGLSEPDLDILCEWVLASGIRWGLSKEQRQQMGVASFSEATWSSGLERLLMGYAIDSDDFVDGVLPFPDIEGGGAVILGGLCQFISIIENGHNIFAGKYRLGEWSEILLEFTENIFGESDQKGYMELRNILSDPGENMSQFHRDDVSFDVICEWMKLAVSESRSSSGFLRGQLTFCSMLPMRSVPFKVICLLGLNDGVFPKNDNQSTFDLMAGAPKPGDRSARADDRYQFMEAILAARSSLYLSYVGRSIKTNDDIPPSVVVTEFIEVLKNSYGLKDSVVAHPLHPFSKKYFLGDRDVGSQSQKLFSYDQYYCRTAENLQAGSSPPKRWWQQELELQVEKINFPELLAFFRNPQSFFVNKSLGVRLEGGEELPEERELFQPGGLEKYLVEQKIVARAISGEKEDILKRLMLEGRWPLGKPGEIRYQEKLIELEGFSDLVCGQNMGQRIADIAFEFKVGGYTLVGTLSNLYEHGIMIFRYADVKGKDLLVAWIHHLIGNRLLGEMKTVLVGADDVFTFGGENDLNPDLSLMIDYFVEGSVKPSALYVEPALAYCKQLASKRSKVPPLDKARHMLQHILENGYEPCWNLLLQAQEVDDILAHGFESGCLDIMNPIWSMENGN